MNDGVLSLARVTKHAISPHAAMRLARRACDEESARGSYTHPRGTPSAVQRQLREAVRTEAGGPSLVAALCLVVAQARSSTERLHAFGVLEYLVARSSTARAAVFMRVADVILPLCCESDSARHQLPAPRRDAARLQRRSCNALRAWERKYGHEAPVLCAAARVAAQLASGEKASAAHTGHVQAQAMRFYTLARIVKDLDQHFGETRTTLESAFGVLDTCLGIIVPKFGENKGVLDASSAAAARSATLFAPKQYREGEPVPPQPQTFTTHKDELLPQEAETAGQRGGDEEGEEKEEEEPAATLELFDMMMKAMAAEQAPSAAADFEEQLAAIVARSRSDAGEDASDEEEDDDDEGRGVSGLVSDDYELTLEIDMDAAFKKLGREADSKVGDVMATLRDYARLLSVNTEVLKKGVDTPALRLNKWAVQLEFLKDYEPETACERAAQQRAQEYLNEIAALAERIRGYKEQLSTLGIASD